MGLLSHVWPLSCERRIATLPPRVPWAFLCPLSRVNPSTTVPLGSTTIWLAIVWFCALGSKIGRAGSQVAPSLVLRANHVGPWKLTDRSNARALECSLGEMSRSQTAYT